MVLRALSTSAPAPNFRVEPSFSRRGTCDRGIWMKPLAFAADAGELIFIYGFSMVVSPFDRPRSARSQIVDKRRCSTAKPIIAQNANLVAEKIPVTRTRDSVRRASGFVHIAISLIEKDK